MIAIVFCPNISIVIDKLNIGEVIAEFGEYDMLS
jgi:hypothetical protein